ncbi:MAG: hypothetical protein V1776_02205 [Candidatus Diapherotrites archaeon]
MRAEQRSLIDWVLVGVFAVGLIAFFFFINQRTATGNVTGMAFNEYANCYSFSQKLPVVVAHDPIILCPDTIQQVDYFAIQIPQITIKCNGSTIQGNGGALFVPEGVSNPHVTLENCRVENFDGLYSQQNPVDVYLVN